MLPLGESAAALAPFGFRPTCPVEIHAVVVQWLTRILRQDNRPISAGSATANIGLVGMDETAGGGGNMFLRVMCGDEINLKLVMEIMKQTFTMPVSELNTYKAVLDLYGAWVQGYVQGQERSQVQKSADGSSSPRKGPALADAIQSNTPVTPFMFSYIQTLLQMMVEQMFPVLYWDTSLTLAGLGVSVPVASAPTTGQATAGAATPTAASSSSSAGTVTVPDMRKINTRITISGQVTPGRRCLAAAEPVSE